MEDVKHIVSFSGGKDSTCMLLKMIESNMPIDRIICIDTTKEFPEMYNHIDKVQEYIKPLKIEIIKIDYDYWFSEYVLTKGKNINKKGYGWTSNKFRWCSGLKIEAFRSLLANQEYNPRQRKRLKQNVINSNIYIGYSFDEPHRAKSDASLNETYPLIDWKITGEEALQYCYNKGFDWGGLYKTFKRVSCYCCPLSRINELKHLYNNYPELWQNIKNMDKLTYRKFRADVTLDQLEDKFKYCIY